MARIYNPSDGPLIISEAGHSLGGREHTDADVKKEPVKGHLDAGRLINLDKIKPGPEPTQED